MIGIVVAMQKEANLFLDNAKITKQEKYAQKDIYFGSFENKEFVLIISGIGKVNASLSTQILITKFNATLILNYGTCGGLDENMKICDFYMIKKAFYYDFDLSEIDNVNIGYMQDYDLTYFKSNFFKNWKSGILATGDRFSKRYKYN